MSNTRCLTARKLSHRLTNNGRTPVLSTHKLFWFTYHWAPQPLGIYGSASENQVSRWLHGCRPEVKVEPNMALAEGL